MFNINNKISLLPVTMWRYILQSLRWKWRLLMQSK